MDRRDEESWTIGDGWEPVEHRRFAAIEGRGCKKAKQSERDNVLFRVHINRYFST